MPTHLAHGFIPSQHRDLFNSLELHRPLQAAALFKSASALHVGVTLVLANRFFCFEYPAASIVLNASIGVFDIDVNNAAVASPQHVERLPKPVEDMFAVRADTDEH